jgi:hypothetical protein
MLVVFVVVAVVLVVAIGLVAVGAVTGRLATEPPTSVFDLDEAVHYVADRLPDDVTAELTYDEVRAVLGWYLDYLEVKGVAARSDHELEARPSGPIVAGEDEGVAFVLGRATEAGVAVDDVQVLQVVEAGIDYLTAIGAIGTEVPPPPDPTASGA